MEFVDPRPLLELLLPLEFELLLLPELELELPLSSELLPSSELVDVDVFDVVLECFADT